MKSTKLSLNQIYGLAQELTGNESFKGLLSQPLSLKTKYWLQRLLDTVAPDVKAIDELKNNLIKELGTQEGESYSLSPQSENFPKFVEQFNEMMSQEKEIRHAVFNLEDFDAIESAEHYMVFLQLLNIDEEIS